MNKKKSKSQTIGTLCRILIDHILPFLQNLCVKRDRWGQLHKRARSQRQRAPLVERSMD